MEEIRFFNGAWVVWDLLAGAPRATQPDDVFAEALPIIVNADTPASTLNGGSGADVYRITSSLSAHVTTLGYIDDDANDNQTWSLSGADAELFEINSNGALVWKTSPSYDAVNSDNNSRSVTATITDDSGQSDAIDINVTVLEFPPIELISATTLAPVSEDQDLRSTFYTARGTYEGSSNDVTYSLTTNEQTLDGLSIIAQGVASLGNVQALFGVSLDHETRTEEFFIVRVIHQPTGLYRDFQISFAVTDVEDNPPEISGPASPVISEDASAGTLLGTYTATTDVDGDTISWSIAHDTSGGAYAIDAQTGALTLADPTLLDYGTNNPTVVSLRATSSANTAFSEATYNVTIIVTDVAEAPVIDQGDGLLSVSTVQIQQTLVTTLSASDDDVGATQAWTLAGADANLFDFDADSGQLSWKIAPIFDATTPANNIRTVSLGVTDDTGRSDSIEISINVLEEAPIELTSAAVLDPVPEDQTLGANFYTISTSYQGSDANMSYQVISDPDSLVGISINANTGVVSAANIALDYETSTDASFIIRATHTLTGLHRDFTITVPVGNINEAPVIDENTPTAITATVGESALTSITATDPDLNDLLTWHLTGADADDFNITADGAISWKTPPATGQTSADLDSVFDITVTVSDDEALQDMIDLSITLV